MIDDEVTPRPANVLIEGKVYLPMVSKRRATGLDEAGGSFLLDGLVEIVSVDGHLALFFKRVKVERRVVGCGEKA